VRFVHRLLAVALLGVGWLLAWAPTAVGQAPTVLVTRVAGPITPVVADQLAGGVGAAERDRHAAFLVELDTPGGLDSSMRQISQAFLNARVPVVVYVTPAGARAASAGAIITFSAHVAAMAPGTTIGAATPVDLQGGEISDKVINDAAAFAEAVAAERGRSTTFAVDTVRKGRAVTADQAVRLGAVDLVAADRAGLLEALDGRQVEVAPGTTVTLQTAGAELVEHELSWTRSLLGWLADPNLAFLFLSIGTLAVIYELASPGMGLGGVIGAVLLVLGFVSLSVLPVNLAGLLLLALAAALFIAELFAPGIGVFAGGGTIALVLAGLLLFDGPIAVAIGRGSAPYYQQRCHPSQYQGSIAGAYELIELAVPGGPPYYARAIDDNERILASSSVGDNAAYRQLWLYRSADDIQRIPLSEPTATDTGGFDARGFVYLCVGMPGQPARLARWDGSELMLLPAVGTNASVASWISPSGWLAGHVEVSADYTRADRQQPARWNPEGQLQRANSIAKGVAGVATSVAADGTALVQLHRDLEPLSLDPPSW
jgi:membrane-bound serine protease (ClpP class)